MEGSNGESIFLIPFNLFVFFGFVPFWTYHNKDNDDYQLHINVIQKIMCVALHIVVILYQVYYVFYCCLQLKSFSEKSLVAFFDAVCNFAFLISIILVMYRMWRQQEGYLQLLEHTRCKQKHGKCGNPSCVYTTLIVCCLFLSVVTWFLINESELFISETVPVYNSTLVILENTMELGIKRNFQFYFYQVMHWGNVVLYVHTVNFFVFAQGLFFVLVLALKQLGAEFRTEMAISKENGDIEKGIHLYRKLRSTTNLTQKMFGDYILTFYVSSVSYYAEAPHILMGKRGNAEIAILIVFTVTSLVWVLAAEFHHRVNTTIAEWIAFYTEKDSLCLEDRLKFLSISSEVSTNPIAVSCRCFNVTYKHLCSMLGVVVTYGVIVVQLNRD